MQVDGFQLTFVESSNKSITLLRLTIQIVYHIVNEAIVNSIPAINHQSNPLFFYYVAAEEDSISI